MLFKQSVLLAALVAVSAAAPASNTGVASLTKRKTNIPDNVPAPPAGQCALLVYSSTILPLGGEPTSESGDGIGPSDAGNPEALVINHAKAIVSDVVALQPQSPGFKASMKLDPNKITNASNLTMTADMVMTGETGWGVEYKYNGKSWQCEGDGCAVLNESDTGLDAYSIHVGNFPC